MSEQQISREKQWSRIVAKAWADEGFKSRLLSNPVAVFQEHGVEVPAGAQVRVVEDTDTVRHFTLPPSPSGELADEDLTRTAADDCHCGGCRHCRHSWHCGHCGCGCDD